MADQVNIIISATDKASNILKGIANIAGSILKTGVLAAAGGITALGGAITGSMLATNKWAESIDAVGDVLGTTSEESAALAVAAQHIGGNVEQLTSQMAIMTRGLFDAQGEIGPTGMILEDLGIAFQDANGAMLPTTDILQAVADKIGAMPDGLEKTQLMMDLFGKSGKDMSDMLGILANGGMEEMNQKAKDLGLSLSDEATAGAIDFGRSMNDLKLAGQGLLVTLGTELMPILQPLIDGFVQWGQDAIPKVAQAIKDLMPTIKKIAEWIDENLIPIIKNVWDWIGNNVPGAIQAAETWFKEHLLPPMTDVYNFIKDKLIPIVEDIYNWLKDKVPQAISETKKWIEEHLLPAWEDTKQFINDHVVPALEGTAKQLRENVPEAAQKSGDAFLNFKAKYLQPWYDFMTGPFAEETMNLVEWLRTETPNAISQASKAWDGFRTGPLQKYIDVIKAGLLGPDGALPALIETFGTLKTWFDTHLAESLRTITRGALTEFKLVWGNIKDILEWIAGKIEWIVQKLLEASKIKLPDLPIPGLASGGLVTMPGVYQLAEEGPELVLNAKQTERLLTNNYWNLTINSPGVTDPFQSFQMMQALARA